MEKCICIAKEFSETLSAKLKKDGQFSGEEFREKIFESKLEEAVNNGDELVIDFDGATVFSKNFLDGAFGWMRDKYSAIVLFNTLSFKSKDDPNLIPIMFHYIIGGELVYTEY